MTRARRLSSTTFSMLSPEDRAHTIASDFMGRTLSKEEVGDFDQLEEMGGLQGQTAATRKLTPEQRDVVRMAIKICCLQAMQHEIALETALDAEHKMRLRLELLLAENGLPIPTLPLPSDPPPDKST
jgi:hypothetical protein